jgi:hypothetical protein
MKTKSFDGATQNEAERLADDWIKSQSGITVTSRRAIRAGIGSPEQGFPENWTILVEYDETSN